jgi:putative redox protein
MQGKVTWLGNKMKFEGESRGFKIQMDSTPPFGDNSAASPKEIVLQGLCGCTAMDTIALLKKYKQTVTHLSVTATTELTEGHPSVFKEIELIYDIQGPEDVTKVEEAVELSRKKYCGVIAMLEKNSNVSYRILYNGKFL